MSERILLTGADGYIGNAVLEGLENCKKHQGIPADIGLRRIWVKEVGGNSLSKYERNRILHCDFSDLDAVRKIIWYTNPTVICHLASQPSAPYSEKSTEYRRWTQLNNLACLLNILTSCHEFEMNPKIIVTTTTGIPGAPAGRIIEGPMPIQAGSWYHVSRGFDSANLSLAARQWKMRILEMRTAITYGVHIEGIDEPVTRFDWDYYFGTVIHRFLLSKKMSIPIPIYGKGLQRKPIIALSDVVTSLLNAIETDIEPGHEIVNQVTQCLSVTEIAKTVGGEIQHVINPRIENEEYQMVIENEKFLTKYLKKSPQSLDMELPRLEKAIDTKQLPSNWKEVFDGK